MALDSSNLHVVNKRLPLVASELFEKTPEKGRSTRKKQRGTRGHLSSYSPGPVLVHHEHVLYTAHLQHPPEPLSPAILSRFSLHLCTFRLQNLTRPRNDSVHSRSSIAVARPFLRSQSPGSQEFSPIAAPRYRQGLFLWSLEPPRHLDPLITHLTGRIDESLVKHFCCLHDSHLIP